MEVAGTIDPSVWRIAGVVIAVLIVVWLAKKALKAAIIIAVVWLVFTFGSGYISEIQQKYNINISGSEIAFELNNKEYNIDLKEIANISELKEQLGLNELQDDTENVDLPDELENMLKMIGLE